MHSFRHIHVIGDDLGRAVVQDAGNPEFRVLICTFFLIKFSSKHHYLINRSVICNDDVGDQSALYNLCIPRARLFVPVGVNNMSVHYESPRSRLIAPRRLRLWKPG